MVSLDREPDVAAAHPGPAIALGLCLLAMVVVSAWRVMGHRHAEPPGTRICVVYLLRGGGTLVNCEPERRT